MSSASRSPFALAALATVAVPGLEIVSTARAAIPDADFDSALLIDAQGDHWIVRVPRGAAAGAGQEAEIRLLRGIAALTGAARLPFDVPEPAGTTQLPEGGHALVYRSLRGYPINPAELELGSQLAAELGRAIAAIHELPTTLVEEAGLPSYDAESYRRRHLAEIDEAALTGVVPPALLERWESALQDPGAWRFRPVVLHGDLAADHILTNGERITAVLDFAQARVADPADDLAWLLLAVDPDVVDTIISAYNQRRTGPVDHRLVERAGLLGELALVRWLLYGVRTNDQEIITDAVEMLQDLDAAIQEEEQAAAAAEQRAKALAQEVAARAARAAESVGLPPAAPTAGRAQREASKGDAASYSTQPLSLRDMPTVQHDLSAARDPGGKRADAGTASTVVSFQPRAGASEDTATAAADYGDDVDFAPGDQPAGPPDTGEDAAPDTPAQDEGETLVSYAPGSNPGLRRQGSARAAGGAGQGGTSTPSPEPELKGDPPAGDTPTVEIARPAQRKPTGPRRDSKGMRGPR